MAYYVALSRVRSLAGLQLSAFDPNSIIVSSGCLQEINRLRETYRKDLPLYDLPKVKPQTGHKVKKRKLTGSHGNPPKKARLADTRKTVTEVPVKKLPLKRKRLQPQAGDNRSKKKVCSSAAALTSRQQRNRTWPFRFNPVDEEWQRNACHLMGLEFVSTSGWSEGGPDVTLTRPRTVKRIQGDGNCLFRCISYLVTGSEEQHGRVREVILDHLRY